MSLVYAKRNAVIAIGNGKKKATLFTSTISTASFIRGGSAGIIESLYGVVKPISILNKSTEVRPSEKIGSGTTEIPFSMFLRQPGKDNLERSYETFHGANISAQEIEVSSHETLQQVVLPGNYGLSFTWATKLYINFDIPKVTKEIMPKEPPKGLDG
nr:down syndrome critical region protein 3 like [Quercus suber]